MNDTVRVQVHDGAGQLLAEPSATSSELGPPKSWRRSREVLTFDELHDDVRLAIRREHPETALDASAVELLGDLALALEALVDGRVAEELRIGSSA